MINFLLPMSCFATSFWIPGLGSLRLLNWDNFFVWEIRWWFAFLPSCPHQSLANRILHSSPLPPSLWHGWTYFVFCVTNCNDGSTDWGLFAGSPPLQMTYVLVKFIFTFTAAWVYTWSRLELVISQECALYCVFGFEIPRNYLASTHTRQTTLPALWSKYPPRPAGIYSTTDPFKELSGFGGEKCFKMQQTQAGQVIIVNWFSAERERDDKWC